MRSSRFMRLESRDLFSGTTSLYAQPFAFDVNVTPNAITADNDWSGAPGLTGHSGSGLATPGVDPRTVVADGSATPVQVFANAAASLVVAASPPTGLAEFDARPDKTLAVRPGANAAPHLLLQLDARGTGNITVGYRLTDIDPTGRDSASAFALQYRIGSAGNFTNLPDGFVADATEPNLAGKVTPVRVTLPADAYGQPLVQIRILAADPGVPAEWVGIDALEVSRGGMGPSRVNFAVDSANSKLALSGEALGLTLVQQGANSLNSSYTGKVAADVDFVANTVNFIAADTLLDATVTGKWQPLPGGGSGSADADYGGTLGSFIAGVNIAGRNIVGTLASDTPLSLSGTGTTLNYPSTQKFTVTDGDVDYRGLGLLAGSVTPGTTPLDGSFAANQATTAGTLALLGNDNFDLTAPILVELEEDINGQVAKFKITGTINTSNAVLPVIDPNGATAGEWLLVNATGGGPAVTLMAGATVTRTPAANLTSLTLTLANRIDGAAEKLAVDLTGTGLTTAGYDAATGTLTITGSAAASVYQTALRTVTYQNADATPNAGQPDSYRVSKNGRLAVSGGGVGANDFVNRLVTVTASDGANSSRSKAVTVAVAEAASGFSVVATPTKGSVNFNADGTFVYTPNANFVGVDTFSYKADGSTNAVPVTITVLDAPPRVAEAVTNDGAVQRSQVTSVRVTFDSAVTLGGGKAADALTLTGPGGQSVAFTAAVTGTNPTVAKIDFAPLADGRYTLTVLAGQVIGTAGQLDGNGDGTGGDDFAFGFHRLFGDSDGNATVNFNDFLAFRGAFGVTPANPVFDFDGDNQVNFNDFLQFRTRFGTSI